MQLILINTMLIAGYIIFRVCHLIMLMILIMSIEYYVHIHTDKPTLINIHQRLV